ncbi:MAG: hypothetical protein RQ899_14520 [Pseudomonadales bacterium]|nr:hypothetical protein [Pseudomonadales bacterium]
MIKKLSLVFSAVVLLAGAGLTLADEDSGNGRGRNKNLGHHNASDGVMGLITANRQIFYSGDPLDIGIRFPRGAQLIANGDVDAYLLIFRPNTDITVLPVSAEASPNRRNLFRISAVNPETLPEGVYQLGVVLTVPDGDPLNVADWYNGLLGMVSLKGLTVSAEALDIDADGDGDVDDDLDDDGFVDDDGSDDVADDDNGSDDVSGDDIAGDDGEEDESVDDSTTP